MSQREVTLNLEAATAALKTFVNGYVRQMPVPMDMLTVAVARLNDDAERKNLTKNLAAIDAARLEMETVLYRLTKELESKMLTLK